MPVKRIRGHSAKLDIEIEQGPYFSVVLTWKNKATGVPNNLTGYTARMHIRESRSSKTALHVMTTENGGIVLGGVAGTIELIIPDATTEKFVWESAFYDLEMVDGTGKPKRLLSGKVWMIPEVTK